MKEKIKHVSLFSGIGAFEKQIKEVLKDKGVDYELVAFSEIDKWAVTSYCAIHDVNIEKNMGDISMINPNEVPSCDLITHGSPCFRAGTLITTDKGLEKIEKIKKGDLVLTHKNRFREVLVPMINKTKEIYKLNFLGTKTTFATGDHPYYVRESKGDTLLDPIWKEVKNLEIGDFVGEFIDGVISWKPFLSKELQKTDENVYNFEVAEDNSYVANSLIVHNCQDFSVAGKGEGGNIGSETRSSLMWYTVNIVKHKNPKYVIWENVKGVLFKKHKHNFDNYLKEMDSLGYNNYYEVLNAKNYGVPQNRERVFVISIRKDIDNKTFEFPKPFDNGIRLRHLLEDYVDEKYYISSERSEKLLEELREKELLNGDKFGADSSINDPSRRDISNCITSRYNAGIQNKKQIGMIVAEPKIDIVGHIKEWRQRGNIYGEEGVMGCLSATDYKTPKLVYKKEESNNKGGREKEVRACLSPDKLRVWQNGRRFKENDEPMFTITAQDRHGVIEKEFCILRNERTEYGKEIRKEYESGLIDEKRGNMTSLAPRTDGVSNTITSVQKDNLLLEKDVNKSSNELQMIEINQLVRVRKHEVDVNALIKLLRKHKKESNLTNRQISKKLNRPITLIEHWFRKDSSFSIPDADIWYKLKDLLKIKTNKFDKSITEFVEKEGVYEKGNRFYHEDGIAPTLTTSANERIIEKTNELLVVGNTVPSNHTADRVFDAKGISPTVMYRNSKVVQILEGSPNNIINLGMLDMKGSEQVRRVYDPNGLCPTLDTMTGGHREPKIIEKNELKFLRGLTDKDLAGDGKDLSRNTPQGERVYDEEGIACSQTANGGGTGGPTGLYLERPRVVIDSSIAPSVAVNFEREKEEIAITKKDIYRPKCTSGFQDNQIGINLSPTLRASNSHTSARDNNYRVRKLTPLECFRLMGFDDIDYYKAKKALMDTYYNGKDRTNSQMYKQAGNSIVTNVLKEIYENLF